MTKESMTIETLIRNYHMQPHPEGGFFTETYRSSESYAKSGLPNRFSGERSFSTAILFLLPEGSTSKLHRIQSDEIWHFYLGGPLAIYEITPDGEQKTTILGNELDPSHHFQYTVPQGNWFGASPLPGSSFSFVGCTVAPGFDFEDFELGKRESLLKKFPTARDVILKLS